MSKHLTLSHLQTILPPIKHLIDKKAEGVDWNENDSDASGYINNRPFYEEFGTEILLDGTFIFDDSFCPINYFEITPGQQYIVIFNGIEYNTTAVYLSNLNALALGNCANFGLSDTGQPFFIGLMEEESIILTYDSNLTEATVKIFGTKLIIHKIDEKFLPEQVELGQGDMIGKAGEAEGAEIFNNYNLNKATGIFSHAEGRSSASGEYSHAEGSGSSSGNYSHAEGKSTSASGDYSHAEGYITYSKGEFSHAEGDNTISLGKSSHAEGYQTRASGESAHSEGYKTFAIGRGSHSEGNCYYEAGTIINGMTNSLTYTILAQSYNLDFTNTIVTNLSNWAIVLSSDYIGPQTANTYKYEITLSNIIYPSSSDTSIANEMVYFMNSGAIGFASHSEGNNTIAASSNQHTQGEYNIIDQQDKYAHIVGNGNSNTSRSNAHTLDWNGNAWYQGDVFVGGNDQDSGERLAKMSDLAASITTDEINAICGVTLGINELIDETSGATYQLYVDSGKLSMREVE